MTGAVRAPTAQDGFWEWLAVLGEPWAVANGYKRRGRKAEFYRRVGRLELVITVVRSMKSTQKEISAWLEGYVLDIPSDRLARSLRTHEEAYGHRPAVFSLAIRDYIPDPARRPTYDIVAGSTPAAWPKGLPRDLDAYRVELEAIAALPNRRRGVFVHHPWGQTRRGLADDLRWYETNYSGVRTIDGRNTDRAIALIAEVDLAHAAQELGKDPPEVRTLAEDPDPLPPDYHLGEVFWRHPDDTDTPIWHEGRAEWWTAPFAFPSEPPTVEQLPPPSTIANPDISRYTAATDGTTRHALSPDRRHTLCGLDASQLRRLSALFVLNRDESCATCQATAQADFPGGKPPT